METKPSLFFDLDGTLLDSRNRLYQLFINLVPQSTLSFEAYWDLKRAQKGHAYILQEYCHFTESEISVFETEWRSNIEMPYWLKLDRPFEWSTKLLEFLYGKYDIYIVTARQFEENAIAQITELGWKKLLSGLLVTQQTKEKADLIQEITYDKSRSWMIGDTGKDIQTGKLLGIKTIGVLSGFRNRESLERYFPDIILDNANEIKPAIL